MTITEWPEAERPREKLLANGAEKLSDAELLAIFIRCGIKGKTAVDLARELLQQYHGIRNLLEAEQQQLCRAQGLGKAKYAELQAALEIVRRYLRSTLNRTDRIIDAEAAYLYLMAKLRNSRQEIFAALFLDNQNHVICYEELARGTINNVTIYPREIVKKALQHNAAALILAHNHPAGIATPSPQDQHLTRELTKILAIIDVEILDHIVIGESGFKRCDWKVRTENCSKQ